MPCGGFGHFDAGEAGGDHTAMDDQKHASADGAAANSGKQSWFSSRIQAYLFSIMSIELFP